MKKSLLPVVAFSLVVALSSAGLVRAEYDVEQVGEQSEALQQARQRIRIDQFYRARNDFEEKQSTLNADLSISEEELKAMVPSARAAYDNRVERERKRLADARKRLDERRAVLTEEDLKIVAERDAAEAAKREQAEARLREVKEAARRKREAKWNEAKRNGEISY